MTVPEKPTLEGLEAKWDEWWEAAGTHRFDRSRSRGDIYAIDTPPPTASGTLHVGHVFSYTQTDLVARFQRMRDKTVFYPMGWDDNGLPTERRVQNYFGVRCDPSLAYDPGFDVNTLDRPDEEPVAVSRPNFIELCERLTAEDEKAFEELFRRLGLSVDWSVTYTTIDDRSRRASQRAFLRLLQRGLAYRVEAPTMWDVDFQTAVAQAEIEDRETRGAYHLVRFDLADGSGSVRIETSRPELIPACVALVANPSDERYEDLVGRSVVTPLFGAEVPIVAHELADPERGTGIAMICTFGDLTDVTWWRELRLPTRVVVGKDGAIVTSRWGEPGWGSRDAERAARYQAELAGLPARRARTKIAELLAETGALIGEPQPVRHVVKFYERGERPLEVVSSRQWFVKTLEFRDRLLERGREIGWHPEHMRARYESWVEGLNGDWCVSRQRFFGVPFPVWYPLDDRGEPDHERPLLPDEARLPVDPSSDVPDGYTEGQRGRPGGFIADPDVMDTWATSSLSPQIAGGWEEDADLFARVFPMDLRPQSHEIIRTWLFYTVLKAELEHGSVPWAHAAISGWVLDPERKKMSKSKGNVVTPIGLLDEYGSDAVRYWAASARLGVDTAFKEEQIRIGRRLAIKILNASRFVLRLEGDEVGISDALDRSMLHRLAGVVGAATEAFEEYEHARALELAERFFWGFTDDYLELVKSRAYGAHGPEAAGSAIGALRAALSVVLRLFAPFLPYVTEEVWSWWRQGSIHRSAWPTSGELEEVAAGGDPQVYEVAAWVLGEVRKAKALAKVSLRTEVERVVVRDSEERLKVLEGVARDVREAGNVVTIEGVESSESAVRVRLPRS
ncbi:MAG TPA: valine--tRNA ligase [Actinomycetota bacterium]|nr:valine--tRNA ligase [Actinomycetota bacterium]